MDIIECGHSIVFLGQSRRADTTEHTKTATQEDDTHPPGDEGGRGGASCSKTGQKGNTIDE